MAPRDLSHEILMVLALAGPQETRNNFKGKCLHYFLDKGLQSIGECSI